MAGCSRQASLRTTGLEYVGFGRAAFSARKPFRIDPSLIGALPVLWGGYGGHSLGRRSCRWKRMPVGYSTLPGVPGQPSGESPSGAVGQCGVQVVSDTVAPLLALT